MARYDDLDTSSIALVTIISSVILLILILGGRAASSAWETAYDDLKTEHAKYVQSDEKIAGQKALLTKAGRIEVPPVEEGKEPTQRLTIPIEKAIELVKEELKAKAQT